MSDLQFEEESRARNGRLHRSWTGVSDDLPRKFLSATIEYDGREISILEVDPVLKKFREYVDYSFGRGRKSLSEITELPGIPPPEVQLGGTLPSSHPWRYRSARRLLRVLHATKERPSNSTYIPYIAVSKRERDLLFEWRPLLRKHDGFRAFTQYLIHHTFRTERENEILASKDVVRRNFGVRTDYEGSGAGLPQDARAIELLWLYALLIDPKLRFRDYHHPSGKARTIKEHGIPEEIREEALDFYLDRRGREGVVLMTGASPDDYYQRNKSLETLLAEADRKEPEVKLPEATFRIIDYHNWLVQDRGGKQMFTELAKNARSAVEHLKSDIDRIDHIDDDSVAGIRASIRRIRSFENLPRPVYKPAKFTPRPTSLGGNHLMQIPSEALAEMFTSHHVYLDGSKIQLALFERFARKMGEGCPTVREYLQRHLYGEFDLWREIGSSMDLQDEGARRDAAKRGMYAALYFSGAPNLYREICETYAASASDRYSDEWPRGEQIEGFFDHPVVEELLEVREALEEEVESRDYIEDAFGIERSLNDFSDRSNPKRTMLSCLLQGHELKLMRPLYEIAEEERRRDRDDRFRIALYKYDGILLWMREGHKERVRRKWVGRMQETFSEHADDVLTRLDVEEIGAEG